MLFLPVVRHWAGIGCLVLAFGAGGKQLPPKLELVERYGCKIVKQAEKDASWRVDVWADYVGKTGPDEPRSWSLWFAQRPSLKRAMKDCDEWMGWVRKELKKRGR